MDNYDNWELYNAFANQCTCDKRYITDIYLRMRTRILMCGKHLLKHHNEWYYILPLSEQEQGQCLEFLDFLDGNGFTIKPIKENVYCVIPNYTNSPITTVKTE